MKAGIVLAALPLASGSLAEAPHPATSSVGAPNPAAVFCIEEGGQHIIVGANGQQRGICRFSDGREVDAWQFFREPHGVGEARVINPAAQFCLAGGGRYRVERTPAGDVGLCTPAGGAEIDAWQFYRNAQRGGTMALGNPAARFCIAQGGSYRIARTTEGDRGYCSPPGGTEVDAWQHFRQQMGASQGRDK
ncbi:MAG: DUF333 domain-containing protein [Erythrobacter sp.]|jgi:putative hemolysin|nr:DUF333 domain-containing protein [Erythrobacter sp.]